MLKTIAQVAPFVSCVRAVDAMIWYRLGLYRAVRKVLAIYRPI